MKRIPLILSLLLFPATSAMAQKLSATTETLLLQRDSERLKMPGRKDTKADTIQAYVKVSDPAALDAIERLGGKVRRATSFGDYVTATLPLAIVRQVAELDGVSYVRAGNEATLLMDAARSEAGADQAQTGTQSFGPYTGKGVVVGIVDNGFEYGHADFRSEDGSTLRIKRVWDQNSSTGRAPEGFGYGTEYTTPEELLAARYDVRSTFHGSHVTGIAAGGDRQSKYYGVAPDADIVLVSFMNSDVSIAEGVKYIFDYAKSVGKPCVVNVSLGSHKGPHDGTSACDRLFDELTGPGRIIVGAAGNEAGYKMHASKLLTEEDPQLKTMIGYSDNTASSKASALDIWGGAGTKMSVKVVVVNTMTGKIMSELEPVSSDNPQSVDLYFPTDSYVSGYAKLVSTTDPDNHRPNVQVTTSVTAIPTNRKVGVVVTGEPGSEVHIWNNRYGDLLNANKAGWTAGDNRCTVGEIGGTGKSVISVGSYNTKMSYYTISGDYYTASEQAIGKYHDISAFSSLGPTADGRTKPEVTAPGAAVVSATSQYYTGFLASNSVAASTGTDGKQYYYDVSAGTSMASPYVAGTVALWLQADPNLTPDDVRDLIDRSSRQDEFTSQGVDTPNTWGAGKIDTFQGLLLAAGQTGIEDLSAGQELFSVTNTPLAREFTVSYADNGQPASLVLYNAQGQEVLRRDLVQSPARVSTVSLPAGVYVARLTLGGRTHSVKLAW